MPPRKKSADAQETVVEGAAAEAAPSAASPKRTFKGKSAAAQLGAVLSSDLVQAIGKTYGNKSLLVANDRLAKESKYLPTGVFALDYALGGGWKVGGIHTLFGHKSTCKTTTLFRTIGEAQKMCGNCWASQETCECDDPREPVIAYIDVEGAVDREWASRFLDLEKMLLSVPEYAEQALMIGEALLRSEKTDILIFDSLAFMTTSKEIENSIEKENPGIQARVIGKGIRKFTAALNDATTRLGKRPTVFFTNQIRMMLNVMFGNPETTPGGKAPGFAAWTEVKTKGGKYKMDEKDETAIYVDFGFSIDKSKQGGAKTSYDYRVILADTDTKKYGDIYEEDFLVDHAERHKVITGGGSSWHCLGRQFRKKTDIEDALLKEPAFKAELKQALLKVNRRM
jgi:recombination protein RecA